MAIEDIQTNLRLPSNLKEVLQASADAAGRSLSAEAAHRLSMSYDLENQTRDLHSSLMALEQRHQTTLNSVDGLNVRLRVKEREVAKLEQQLETIKESRQADIAAATKYFQDREAAERERALVAEREATMARETFRVMQLMTNVLSVFLREAVAASVEGKPLRPQVARFAEIAADAGDAEMIAFAEVARNAIVHGHGIDHGKPVGGPLIPDKAVQDPAVKRIKRTKRKE